MQKWYACVANAKWMLNDVQNESFAEQLREKTRHYKETSQDMDFFLVCEPEWLDKQHPEESKKVGRPCVALIGTDYAFMKCDPLHPHHLIHGDMHRYLDTCYPLRSPHPAGLHCNHNMLHHICEPAAHLRQCTGIGSPADCCSNSSRGVAYAIGSTVHSEALRDRR